MDFIKVRDVSPHWKIGKSMPPHLRPITLLDTTANYTVLPWRNSVTRHSDWVIDQLIDYWLIYWFIDQLIDWSIDCSSERCTAFTHQIRFASRTIHLKWKLLFWRLLSRQACFVTCSQKLTCTLRNWNCCSNHYENIWYISSSRPNCSLNCCSVPWSRKEAHGFLLELFSKRKNVPSLMIQNFLPRTSWITDFKPLEAAIPQTTIHADCVSLVHKRWVCWLHIFPLRRRGVRL